MVLARYTVLALAFPLACAAGAQSITLVDPGNVPVPGSSFLVHRGAYVAPQPGGAGQFFDLNALTSTSSTTYSWQDPASLPNGGQFPEAEFALTNEGPDTIFYKATAAGIERIGDTQTISAVGTDYPFTTVFSNSVLELALPLTYGEPFWTDLFEGSFTVDGTPAVRNGSITGSADAWGYIVMPGGQDTVHVLRVTTRLTEAIPLTISGFPIEVNHIHNVNAYYPAWGKFPVVRTVSDSLTSQFLNQDYSYTEWLDATALGVADAEMGAAALQVFPNPAQERATVVFASASTGSFDVQVIDARGAVVQHVQTMGRTVDLDVSKWEAGLYQVVLTHADGQRSVRPLVVAH